MLQLFLHDISNEFLIMFKIQKLTWKASTALLKCKCTACSTTAYLNILLQIPVGCVTINVVENSITENMQWNPESIVMCSNKEARWWCSIAWHRLPARSGQSTSAVWPCFQLLSTVQCQTCSGWLQYAFLHCGQPLLWHCLAAQPLYPLLSHWTEAAVAALRCTA